MTSIAKIKKNDLEEYWRLSRLAGSYASKIEDRIDYVLRRIYQEFGGELDYWYFDGAEEGEVGNLDRNLHKDRVSGFVINLKSKPLSYEMFSKLDDGTYAEFGYSFPNLLVQLAIERGTPHRARHPCFPLECVRPSRQLHLHTSEVRGHSDFRLWMNSRVERFWSCFRRRNHSQYH